MSFDPSILAFWTIAAIAAWVQTLTGFALGLILMGATGALGLMPVPQAAAITSLLVVVNAVIVLMQGWRDVDRPALRLIMTGALPALIAGFLLLNWLAGTALGLLQFLLGVAVAGSAAQLAARPSLRKTRSSPASFLLSGVLGGMMGGLFATTGPPVIWQLYRQPMPLAAVRVTLVSVFLLTQSLRAGLVIGTGGITLPLLISAAGAAPSIVLGTWLARRFPPPVETATIRKLALLLLFMSGLSLIFSSFGKLA